MKRYEVKFSVKEGKIPLVRLFKNLTNMGLAEAKKFVEDRWNCFDSQVYITVIVTEQQLGKCLIKHYMNSSEYNSLTLSIVYIKELEEYTTIDLTQL
jgi:hypothetical protein